MKALQLRCRRASSSGFGLGAPRLTLLRGVTSFAGMAFHELVLLAAQVMEGLGVAVIVGGSLGAAVVVGARAALAGSRQGSYRALRQHIGRAILLGLELLVGADIIRTVSEIPSLEKVLVLAIIVLIRTFLSFALEVELEGRWPWRNHAR